jgi:hypothetical protein
VTVPVVEPDLATAAPTAEHKLHNRDDEDGVGSAGLSTKVLAFSASALATEGVYVLGEPLAEAARGTGGLGDVE